MSLTSDRQDIAAALSTVDGVTGHTKRPPAPNVGDGWPILGPLDRAEGDAFTVTWRVLVALPADEVTASDWLDGHVYDLADALESAGWVEKIEPVVVSIERTDTYAVQFTVRSE